MADDNWIYLENVQVGVGKNNSARWVQVALNEQVDAGLVADGVFGPVSKAAYSKWQRKLGYIGADADGTPGITSLTELGKKACPKFTVRKKSDEEPTTPTQPNPPATSGRKAISPKDVTFNRYNGATGTAAQAQWIEAGCKAAGVPYNDAWRKGYQTAIMRESSGDPNACNTWDSNAKNPPGYSSVKDYGNDGIFTKPLNGKLTPFQCSRGAWQCIPQTFASYHAAGTSNNIYDPVASCAASILYVRANYGVAADGSNLASKVQQFDPNRPPKGY
jgi:hypothetical protein